MTRLAELDRRETYARELGRFVKVPDARALAWAPKRPAYSAFQLRLVADALDRRNGVAVADLAEGMAEP